MLGLFAPMESYVQLCKACDIKIKDKRNIKKNKKGKGDIKSWEQIKFNRKCK